MFDDFYGLTGRPFQLTPDPAFYFESNTHRKALSYLGYGLAQGEGFIVITGEVGAGKSTLVAHLMATIDPARLTAAQVVTSSLDGEEIVHVVAQSFGLDVVGHDKAAALGSIESFLHEEARAGRRCLLIVDESQNLSIDALEELRMLSNFQLGAHPLLQTLLLGQPEFREKLQGHSGLEQLRQRVIASHHLQAMEEGEVRPYVEHRMTCVGWQGNPAFDAEVFPQLHAASGGVPRRINQILNRLLLLGAVEQCDRIDSARTQHVLSDLGADAAGGSEHADRVAEADIPVSIGPESAADAESSEALAIGPVRGDWATHGQLQSALIERDAQISELQQAVIELANAVETPAAITGLVDDQELAALKDQVAALESRLAEQERTIRHTLTMLIEWIEAEGGHRAAA